MKKAWRRRGIESEIHAMAAGHISALPSARMAAPAMTAAKLPAIA